MTSLPVLADRFERRITYLRVSLTDRCNYRCTYCMPEEGVTLLPREHLLSFEEIERIVRVFTSLGVRRVRLTGGEPTIRQGVVELVGRLARLVPEVVMTTNGHRLVELAGELASGGLAQLNVSVDTLDPEKFRAVTRRGDLERVLAGLEAARAAGIAPIKLNCVALKGFNDGEVAALCEWAWQRGFIPRFIEWMPMSDGVLYAPGRVMTAAEIRAAVGQPLVPDEPPGSITGPARYWRSPRGKVGIISAMSEHFCDTCNRVRLTSVGELHACLGYDDGTDLRRILRAGGGDDALRTAIQQAVGAKRQGHEFTRDGCGAPRKHMVSIGG